LSNLRLVSLLSTSGFMETTTPCLFRHVSRPISFVLVVDDFGIKYQNRDDYDYLISCLSRLYLVKSHPLPPSSWALPSLTIAPSAPSLLLTQATLTPCCTAFAPTASSRLHHRPSITLPFTARPPLNTQPPIPPHPPPLRKRKSSR
jgi:hypothetical protein